LICGFLRYFSCAFLCLTLIGIFPCPWGDGEMSDFLILMKFDMQDSWVLELCFFKVWPSMGKFPRPWGEGGKFENFGFSWNLIFRLLEYFSCAFFKIRPLMGKFHRPWGRGKISKFKILIKFDMRDPWVL